MLRAVIVWSMLTLLVSAVTACPMINCPMMQISQSSDDCCSPANHPSDCPQHQSSLDCPFQVAEKALISKVSAQFGDPAVAGPFIVVPVMRLEAVASVRVREFLVNGRGQYLQLRTLLI